MTNTAHMLDIALEAYDAGICVIPVKTDGSKVAAVTWEQYQTERPTREQIVEWFTDHHRAAAAICGPVSGGLIMLEMEGADYEAGNWQRFRDAAVAELGEDRWRQITACVEMSPSGGPHLMIRCTEATVGNLKLARRPNGNGAEVIMETRGRNGYTIIAGSEGHKTGIPWARAQGTYADIATVTGDELHTILDAARTLDEMPVRKVEVDHRTTERRRDYVGDSVFDLVVAEFNRRTSWETVLEGVFELAYTRGTITHWHRIGSDNETGATTNGTGNDTLIVFSSSTIFESYDGTGPAPSYDRFSAHCELHHGGDRTDAYRALRDQGYGPPAGTKAEDFRPPEIDPETGEEVESDPDDDLPTPIDWGAFWAREAPEEDWLCEPLLARGRQTALFAAAKVGKSLLMLEVAAALATGKGALRQGAGEPVDVVYADYEMTEDDLYERLEALGYGADDDLSHLHYYLLPSLRPLNTDQGGWDFVRICERHGAQAAVIDTFGRSLDGEENANDTYNAFYRFCGLRLKQRGIALARLDHSGKDATKGQRGGSAKDGDVDIVWRLEPLESGVRMRRTHARMSWVPEEVTLIRVDDGALRHTVTGGGGYPAGTAALAELLDDLGVPASVSARQAARALRDAGEQSRDVLVRAAQKYRNSIEFREPPA